MTADDPGRTAELPVAIAKTGTVLVVLVVWAAITVGIAFQAAEVTSTYKYLTLTLALLLSQFWGIPVAGLGKGE